MTALAVVGGVFFVVTFRAVVRDCDEDPACERPGPYPGLLVAIPPVSAWYGLVVLPRDARLLGKRGRRHELRPVFAERRERKWLGGVWPYRRMVTRAWLVATAPSGEEVAIPVSEYDGRRCRPSTAAFVRGDLRPGRRVVLDFPSEVIWPTGRVERAPDDAHPLLPAAPATFGEKVVSGPPRRSKSRGGGGRRRARRGGRDDSAAALSSD